MAAVFGKKVMLRLLVARGEQRALHLAAGDVAGVDDAACGVAALAGEVELAAGAPVELRAQRDQLLGRGRGPRAP